MSVTIYNCEAPGNVITAELTQEESAFRFSQFFIVAKYKYLYREAQKRFTEENTPYALPGIGKALQPYYGFDRDPLQYTPDGAERFPLSEMTDIFRHLPDHDSCEIIFVNIENSGINQPGGMTFFKI